MTFTNKVVVLSVLHPLIKKTFNTFFSSLLKQTYKDFDLFIGDDGFIEEYGEKNFENIISDFKGNISFLKVSYTPIKNRQIILEETLKKDYELLIFADSDEYMDERRIELVVKYFYKNSKDEIVFNNMRYENFSLFYKEKITFYDILDFNVLGFGAMNIRKSIGKFVLEIMKISPPIFDWFFALVYLGRNDNVFFLKNALNYRINHSFHSAKICNIFNPDSIKKAIHVKKNTYLNVINYFNIFDNIIDKKEKIKTLEGKLREIERIEKYIFQNGMKKYIEHLKKYFTNRKYFYWWEYILSLEKLLKERQ